MADPGEPLAAVFARLIADSGPISLARFMAEANARYYNSRDPLGSAGDFVTAPEISQMFGELIGAWLADLWLRAGRPSPVHYVELGPGRGTLAQDALRVAARYGLEPAIHLVEPSAALRQIQRQAIPAAQWHHDLSTVPLSGPILVVANEFLDALPARQLVRTEAGWRERMVGYEDGRLLPVAGAQVMDAAVPEGWRQAPVGTIVETSPAAAAMVEEVARRLADQGGAALFIDYGHAEPRTGSTFQAVREHARVDPFATPGAADLTALVDFATLGAVARRSDARVLGIADQGPWLRSLGIDARAAALTARSPERTDDISAAVERLTGAAQMGTLFKVMGLAAPGWPGGAGF